MQQQQLAFDAADPAPSTVEARAAAPRAAAPVRHRQALVDFLDEVTRRVREAADVGDGTARPDGTPPATLRHTVRNAQMIAARARRAIDALPGTDLELLRSHGRLVAAARDAHEARLAAEFAAGGRVFGATDGGPRSSLVSAETPRR